jgi:hypothetical protein
VWFAAEKGQMTEALEYQRGNQEHQEKISRAVDRVEIVEGMSEQLDKLGRHKGQHHHGIEQNRRRKTINTK